MFFHGNIASKKVLQWKYISKVKIFFCDAHILSKISSRHTPKINRLHKIFKNYLRTNIVLISVYFMLQTSIH